MRMTGTALITGASGGIGAEFARYHAEKGGNLILVARREEALQALKTELEAAYGVQVMVIAADLSLPESAGKVFEQTGQAGMQIDILINNAGFGGYGKFHERDLSKEQAMMQVNMVTLTTLTHLYLPGMVARRSGKILNVASTAGFLPGPLQAVYFATKSYVVSFSQAIAHELKDAGITVTALCPGPVDTGFVAAGDLDGVPLWDKARPAPEVARFGYDAMLAGKLVVINERSLRFLLNWVLPFAPRRLALKISQSLMEKKG